MAEMAATVEAVARRLGRHRGLILPIGVAAMIFVILVPLPPVLMDLLLSANIAVSAIILLTSIYVSSPLEFSVFPSVLLGATLARLVLNVATTRLILTAGAGGQTAATAHYAAGKVIWAFSRFVTSGSLPVGVILFGIIAVIQFLVVTRGASRISEVAARFVLDAMPGKQMAIDADVSAGLVEQAEARDRRHQVAREADFYGAMDGASKFLRGDALAGVIITIVNIFGGLYVGLVQYRWGWSETAGLFTRLTIGDGLVNQVPALLVSMAAALLVTRSTARTNLSEEVTGQLFSKPIVLLIAGFFLAALALTSLPKLPLLAIGFGCVGLASLLFWQREAPPADTPQTGPAEPAPPAEDELDQLLAVDPMRLEIGYSLVRLVDPASGGELLDRIGSLRRRTASELGLIVPPIRVRDNMRLGARQYSILIRGAEAAAGELHLNRLLAVQDGDAAGKLIGHETVEPAFHTPAVWISPSQQEAAETMGYTVVNPTAVLITHLDQVIRRNAAELLGRRQVTKLLDGLKARVPDLAQEATDRLRVGEIQQVLQNLLREGVSIRDFEAILEALTAPAEIAARNPEALTEQVRVALGKSISQQYCSPDGRLWCTPLQGDLAERIGRHVEADEAGRSVTIPPDLSTEVAEALGPALAELRSRGCRPVVVCPPHIRGVVRQMLHAMEPDTAVLAYSEIRSVEVHPLSVEEDG